MKYFLSFLLLAFSISVNAQNKSTIYGTITNKDQQPVLGAFVRIINTSYSTLVDKAGNFNLPNIPNGSYQLRITAVGYASQNKTITLPGDKSQLIITLINENFQLNEVVVTAQKREELLQKIPISISSISAVQIQEYQLKNTKDITAIIPNLNSANPGDNRNVTGIRGIATTSYDPAIATYVDGVNQFGLDTYISQLLDIERIEVLRGPQGTLYGRNAMGGVINIITKQPTNKLKGFVQGDFGNFGQQRYSLGISAPLIENKLFLGLSGLYSGQDGFYTNVFNNSHFDKQNSLMGNYYLKYLATQKLAVTLNVKHNNNHNNGTFPLAGSKDDALQHPFEVNQNQLTRMTDNLLNASLSINHSGQQVNFSSQSAYQSNYRFYNTPIDGDFSPIDGISIINNYGRKFNNVKVLSQEFKFSSANTVSPFSWTAGTYSFYQNNPTKQAIRFGADAKRLGLLDSNFSVISTSKGTGYGMAFFGQGSYKISNKIAVTLGARYDYEYKKLNVLGEYQKDPDPNPIFETRPDTTTTASFKAFSPQAIINFNASANSIIYTSYNRGFRAGGLTALGADPSQPPLAAYRPEYSNNFEIGSKNTFFDNRLTLNAALFYTRVIDAQVPTLILPSAITVTTNAGKLSSKGGELELNAKLLKGVSLEYSLGVTDAKFKSLILSQNGSAVNLAGKRQLFTPKTTSMTALQYAYLFKSKANLKMFARGEWRYLDKQYFDLANNISQADYSLLNARIGVAANRFEVVLWANNLTDKKYIDYAYDFGASHLGAPKTYGITLKTMF